MSCRKGEIIFKAYCLLLSSLDAKDKKSSVIISPVLKETLNLYLHQIFNSYKLNIIVEENENYSIIYKAPQSENNNALSKYFIYINQATSKRLPFTCSNGFYICQKSSKQCIVPQFVCDGELDCPHGEDEQDCNCKIASNQKVLIVYCLLYMVAKQQMITNHWKLSEESANSRTTNDQVGEMLVVPRLTNTSMSEMTETVKCQPSKPGKISLNEHCIFNGDEKNLPNICPYGLHLKGCKHVNCTNTFKCPNSYCIPYKHVCDGNMNCPNGEDEQINCHHLNCPSFFHCKGLTSCLHPSQICDGKVDCSNKYKDDEIMCDENYVCPLSCFCLGLGILCKNANVWILSFLSKNKFKYLSLIFSEIPILEKHLFCSFSHITYLNVSFNSITQISVDTFTCNMAYLEVLDLSSNNINVLVRNQFANLHATKLKHLCLLNNTLIEIRAEAFSGLAYLKVLNLNSMSISNLQRLSFGNITQLHVLNLSYNKITYLKYDLFQGTTKLSKLDMAGNNIRVISPKVLKSIASIRTILTSSKEICCSLPLGICSVRLFNNVENTKCAINYIVISVLIKVLLVCSLVTCTLCFTFYAKKYSSKQSFTHLVLTWTNLVMTLDILLSHLNSDFFAQCFEMLKIVNIVCSFTGTATIVLLQMLLICPMTLALDSCILVHFPFRRKGLTVTFTLTVFVMFLSIFSVVSFLFYNKVGLNFINSVPHSKCVRLVSGNGHYKVTKLLILGLGLMSFISLNIPTTFKLLIKHTDSKTTSNIKQQFGIYSIIQSVVLFLLWLPILIILALPLNNLHETTMSDIIFILTLFIIICYNILFTFIRQDFRNYVHYTWNRIRKQTCYKV